MSKLMQVSNAKNAGMKPFVSAALDLQDDPTATTGGIFGSCAAPAGI